MFVTVLLELPTSQKNPSAAALHSGPRSMSLKDQHGETADWLL